MKEIQHRSSMRWEGRKAGEIKDPKERDIQHYTTKITGNQIPPKQSRKAINPPSTEKKGRKPPQSEILRGKLPGRRLCGPWIMARWLRSFESQYYSWNLVQHGRSHCHLGRNGGWGKRFSRRTPWDPAFFFSNGTSDRPPLFFSKKMRIFKKIFILDIDHFSLPEELCFLWQIGKA